MSMQVEFPLIYRDLPSAYGLRGYFLCCRGCEPACFCQELEAFTQVNPTADGSVALPRRCHKMWLFKQPIRRYDHYCRWLTNAVGLLNHRAPPEFVLMLIGLLVIGTAGTLVDFVLLVWTSSEGHHFTGFLLIMHLTYSVILTLLAGPILRLHLTFVSRNELANEYKHNLFYIMRDAPQGRGKRESLRGGSGSGGPKP
ncbi:PFA3 [Symbiodinium natans]|uniref:Palmitoyltransferase n=1 Tax=Symbiodinium natans TaxID=878477 RepID=A0A812SXL8_9DINO|nr:PFA3 [Symbiodinium natans]